MGESSRLTPKDYAYLAGIIDGEGCLALQAGCSVLLTVTNTSLDLVDYLHRRFGGLNVKSHPPGWSPRCRPARKWEVSGPRARDLIRNALPYIRSETKRRQAILLLTVRSTPRGQRLTDEERALRLYVKEMLGLWKRTEYDWETGAAIPPAEPSPD